MIRACGSAKLVRYEQRAGSRYISFMTKCLLKFQLASRFIAEGAA